MTSFKSSKFLIPALFAVALTCASLMAHGQTFKVLHTFAGAPKDGEAPVGTLVRDAAGNLYGVTSLGGSGACANGQSSCGTVFMLTKAGKEVGVFSFNGLDGEAPGAGLFRDAAGNLYGTTEFGGPNSCGPDTGCGTVFQLNKTGNKIRYYSFDGTDGEIPESPLVEVSGSLFGTTSFGGTLDFGTIYKMNALGKETVLYSFQGASDGCDPEPGLTVDSKGNLYGATSGGSCNGSGTAAYELDTAGNFTVLYEFTGFIGSEPNSALIFDSKGNLYGTAGAGGSSDQCSGGCGTVYELSPSNGTWSGHRLYSFCSLPDCSDGSDPVGPLVRDNTTGNLYGVTEVGGAYPNNCASGLGCGTIFKLDPSGKETVLYSFTGGSDGAFPFFGLVMDASGNLYGVALSGGDISCNVQLGGCGVVFELTP